jgi:transcriptional regulator of arginine metabolism
VSALDKVRRQAALLQVLQEEVVQSQEALRRSLRRRGHRVTQATLSRDLKELRVPCVPTPDGYRYVPPDSELAQAAQPEPASSRLQNVASLEVTHIDANEMAVVIRTLNGRAQGVAAWLDSLGLDEVLATLAGDDTILVIPRSVKSTPRLRRDLAARLQLE